MDEKEFKKAKTTYYLSPELDREMRIEAARLGLRYPSEFITMLYIHYTRTRNRAEDK